MKPSVVTETEMCTESEKKAEVSPDNDKDSEVSNVSEKKTNVASTDNKQKEEAEKKSVSTELEQKPTIMSSKTSKEPKKDPEKIFTENSRNIQINADTTPGDSVVEKSEANEKPSDSKKPLLESSSETENQNCIKPTGETSLETNTVHDKSHLKENNQEMKTELPDKAFDKETTEKDLSNINTFKVGEDLKVTPKSKPGSKLDEIFKNKLNSPYQPDNKKRPLSSPEQEGQAKKPHLDLNEDKTPLPSVEKDKVQTPMEVTSSKPVEGPIVSEAIEEPVIFFYGEGMGAECETGNSKAEGEGSEDNKKGSNSTTENVEKKAPTVWSIDNICNTPTKPKTSIVNPVSSNDNFSGFFFGPGSLSKAEIQTKVLTSDLSSPSKSSSFGIDNLIQTKAKEPDKYNDVAINLSKHHSSSSSCAISEQSSPSSVVPETPENLSKPKDTDMSPTDLSKEKRTPPSSFKSSDEQKLKSSPLDVANIIGSTNTAPEEKSKISNEFNEPKTNDLTDVKKLDKIPTLAKTEVKDPVQTPQINENISPQNESKQDSLVSSDPKTDVETGLLKENTSDPSAVQSASGLSKKDNKSSPPKKRFGLGQITVEKDVEIAKKSEEPKPISSESSKSPKPINKAKENICEVVSKKPKLDDSKSHSNLEKNEKESKEPDAVLTDPVTSEKEPVPVKSLKEGAENKVETIETKITLTKSSDELLKKSNNEDSTPSSETILVSSISTSDKSGNGQKSVEKDVPLKSEEILVKPVDSNTGELAPKEKKDLEKVILESSKIGEQESSLIMSKEIDKKGNVGEPEADKKHHPKELDKEPKQKIEVKKTEVNKDEKTKLVKAKPSQEVKEIGKLERESTEKVKTINEADENKRNTKKESQATESKTKSNLEEENKTTKIPGSNVKEDKSNKDLKNEKLDEGINKDENNIKPESKRPEKLTVEKKHSSKEKEKTAVKDNKASEDSSSEVKHENKEKEEKSKYGNNEDKVVDAKKDSSKVPKSDKEDLKKSKDGKNTEKCLKEETLGSPKDCKNKIETTKKELQKEEEKMDKDAKATGSQITKADAKNKGESKNLKQDKNTKQKDEVSKSDNEKDPMEPEKVKSEETKPNKAENPIQCKETKDLDSADKEDPEKTKLTNDPKKVVKETDEEKTENKPEISIEKVKGEKTEIKELKTKETKMEVEKVKEEKTNEKSTVVKDEGQPNKMETGEEKPKPIDDKTSTSPVKKQGPDACNDIIAKALASLKPKEKTDEAENKKDKTKTDSKTEQVGAKGDAKKRKVETDLDDKKEDKKKEENKEKETQGAANKRKRKISSQDDKSSGDQSEDSDGDAGGKRAKLRGKKLVKKPIQKQQEEDSGSSSESDREENKTKDESKPTPAKEGEQKSKKQRSRGLLGLDVEDVTTILNEDAGGRPMRQSRRIAQQKMKEDDERKQIEEAMYRSIEDEGKKKKKSSKDKDKSFTRSLKPDDNSTDEEEDKKEKRKKKKKKKDYSASKGFDASKAWGSSSDSSTTGAEEEEPYDHHDDDDDVDILSTIIKSDHEFSPESDVDDADFVPIRRARTAKKDDVTTKEKTLDLDNVACEKCSGVDHPEWILLCDTCDKGWHASCLRPAILLVPEGDWHCPPCEHDKLISRLEASLRHYDQDAKKRQAEVLRRERLAYVGVSLSNVIPRDHDKQKRGGSSGRELGSAASGGGSESDSGSSSEDEGPIYTLRQRRQTTVSYKFSDYDNLIKTAIAEDGVDPLALGDEEVGAEAEYDDDEEEDREEEEEDDPRYAHGGKDKFFMSKKSEDEAEEEEKQKKEVAAKKEEEKEEQKEEAKKIELTEEERRPPLLAKGKEAAKGRKKHRALTKLDSESDNDDEGSDEDFRGSSDDNFEESEESSESEEEFVPVRRSTRNTRASRYDKEFIDDDDSEESDAPRKKKSKRVVWSGSSSDSEGYVKRRKKKGGNGGGGGRKGKGGGGSARKPAPKKKAAVSGSDEDEKPKTKRRVQYGLALDPVEVVPRRTRGRQINYQELLDESEEEEIVINNSLKVKPKPDSEEEEFKAEEDEKEEDEEEDEENSDEEDEDESSSDDDPRNKGAAGLKHIKPTITKGTLPSKPKPRVAVITKTPLKSSTPATKKPGPPIGTGKLLLLNRGVGKSTTTPVGKQVLGAKKPVLGGGKPPLKSALSKPAPVKMVKGKPPAPAGRGNPKTIPSKQSESDEEESETEDDEEESSEEDSDEEDKKPLSKPKPGPRLLLGGARPPRPAIITRPGVPTQPFRPAPPPILFGPRNQRPSTPVVVAGPSSGPTPESVPPSSTMPAGPPSGTMPAGPPPTPNFQGPPGSFTPAGNPSPPGGALGPGPGPGPGPNYHMPPGPGNYPPASGPGNYPPASTSTPPTSSHYQGPSPGPPPPGMQNYRGTSPNNGAGPNPPYPPNSGPPPSTGAFPPTSYPGTRPPGPNYAGGPYPPMHPGGGPPYQGPAGPTGPFMRAMGPVQYMGPGPSSGDSGTESPVGSPGTQSKRKAAGRGRGKSKGGSERPETQDKGGSGQPPGPGSGPPNPQFFNQGVPQFRGRMPMHPGNGKMGPLKNSAPRMPGMYHTSHPMDPSPSGGGPINMPDKPGDSPDPSKAAPCPPQGIRYPDNFSMSSPPRHSFPPPPARGYSPNKNFAPPYQTSPGHPPPSYAYAIPPSPYQNSPNMYADFATEDNSDSNTSGGRYEEEPPAPPPPAEGEFGGLVSYFSSQREDDMDT
uniref:Remodeling and spacing factor 1 n=1 Tax=Cacopsylla melanoneura TaxID=428564 RepID=A0A8D8U5S4_9HEMI